MNPMKNLIRCIVISTLALASVAFGREFTGNAVQVSSGNVYISLQAYYYSSDLCMELINADTDTVVASAYIYDGIAGSMDETYHLTGLSGSSNASRNMSSSYQPMWWSITGLPAANYKVRLYEPDPVQYGGDWEAYANDSSAYIHASDYSHSFELSYTWM